MPHEIRMLTSQSDIAKGSRFFKEVWGGHENVVPVDIAIASGHVGGYFSGAFDKQGDLIAASYGFVGKHGLQTTIHSHVTASRVAGAGFALKLHQRDWALAQGFDAITWTFDPLVRRNCVFNLEKLGAVATEYLVNFYGEMHDELNRGEESDRLFAVWPTKSASNTDAADAMPASMAKGVPGIPAAIGIEASGAPAVSSILDDLIAKRSPFLVFLPAEIEALRSSDPHVASLWRHAVRSALQPSFEDGAFVRHIVEDRAALLVEWPS